MCQLLLLGHSHHSRSFYSLTSSIILPLYIFHCYPCRCRLGWATGHPTLIGKVAFDCNFNNTVYFNATVYVYMQVSAGLGHGPPHPHQQDCTSGTGHQLWALLTLPGGCQSVLCPEPLLVKTYYTQLIFCQSMENSRLLLHRKVALEEALMSSACV